MNKDRFTTHKQRSPHISARRLDIRLIQLVWEWVWVLFCLWTPKPLNAWRLLWLRIFGCKIDGEPFVHQRARIEVPWNLILHDRAVLGDRTHVYNLGEIEIGARAILAQESYLCSATHDFDDPNLALQTAKILIGDDVFVGARAFVLPGVHVGPGAIIGACSVVTADIPQWTIAAGNPCTPLKPRKPPARVGTQESASVSEADIGK